MARALRSLSGLAELFADVLGRGGHVRLVASGLSMQPAVEPGDVLLFGPLRTGEPHLGQIVLFQRGGQLVAHRVIELRGLQVVTAGDASRTADPPVARAHLLGALRKQARPLRIRLGLALTPARRLFNRACKRLES